MDYSYHIKENIIFSHLSKSWGNGNLITQRYIIKYITQESLNWKEFLVRIK